MSSSPPLRTCRPYGGVGLLTRKGVRTQHVARTATANSSSRVLKTPHVNGVTLPGWHQSDPVFGDTGKKRTWLPTSR